jgi:energy-coupling factor transporter ATP-binding protein EcfA2
MSNTKWWKCDLQVATPAWDFHFPAGSAYRLDEPQERSRFLDDYMAATRAAGIEVIALADHNTGGWIDDAKAAGARHGVIVFPGCEITTHTGADGVHLLILGDIEKTSQDFDRLIHGALGFDHEHPPFAQRGDKLVPGSSSKTLIQILDGLPDGYLAIAPHALNDNGIASGNTAQGDIRWRAIQHERLGAVDPGDCANVVGDSFNAKFRRRELDTFPRLREMAFISTSDAYSFEQIGSRFTWLRMGNVGIEALRQAFLDHESRVLCDWSPALAAFPERNPNNTRHAWISGVTLEGTLTNSATPLSVPLHPNLNVIIGGRGSGKSSVVAALRQLYSSTESLPKRLKEDADSFVDTVFAGAQLRATHRIQESQEEQQSFWSKATGSLTSVGSIEGRTSFPVTVISQKELFERAAGDKNDPFLSSRSLLALVDASIGYSSTDVKSVDSFGRRLDDARAEWAAAIRAQVLLQSDLAQLPSLRQQLATRQGQVDAFSSPAVKHRLARIESRRREEEFFNDRKTGIRSAIAEVSRLATQLGQPMPVAPSAAEPYASEFAAILEWLNEISAQFSAALVETANAADQAINSFEAEVISSPWTKDTVAAKQDFDAYKQELASKGLSDSEFSRLKDEHDQVSEKVRRLEEQEPHLATTAERATLIWQTIQALLQGRRTARRALLDEVQLRSGRLRFSTKLLGDTAPWVDTFRSIAAFRMDAFLDDVPALAGWLWAGPEEGLEERWVGWRLALSTGDMSSVQRNARLRASFAERLSGLDETVRLRLATLVPDDVVMMEFLRENGTSDHNEDWQSITQGSPGQRTAAMLAFVLHHGREPLVLDQPEDDLDSEWISKLVVKELRQSRWHRQLIVVSHNANIPVLGDAEQVVALENTRGALSVRRTEVPGPGNEIHTVLHIGPVENSYVRNDVQSIMEGGVAAFVRREKKYNNETRNFKGGT